MEVTADNLKNLHHGTILEHKTLKNKDGTPKRCRVNGNLKTWVTRPNEFAMPVKAGLYTFFFLTEKNSHEWTLPEKKEKNND